MMEQLETGNIFTLAIFKRCFGFTKMDAGEIKRLKKAVFASEKRTCEYDIIVAK